MEEMPLVKGIQQKLGSDKMEVLLLSVDLGYGLSKKIAEEEDAKRLVQQNVPWPNVLVPKGFDDLNAKFNFDGYGLTVVDGDGIVRGIDVRGDEIEATLKASLPKQSASDTAHDTPNAIRVGYVSTPE